MACSNLFELMQVSRFGTARFQRNLRPIYPLHFGGITYPFFGYKEWLKESW